jgi:hypothetical protein
MTFAQQDNLIPQADLTVVPQHAEREYDGQVCLHCQECFWTPLKSCTQRVTRVTAPFKVCMCFISRYQGKLLGNVEWVLQVANAVKDCVNNEQARDLVQQVVTRTFQEELSHIEKERDVRLQVRCLNLWV